MNKKLLAIAVAAFVAAPAIAAADTTLYGQLNFEIQSVDGDVNTDSYASRLGVKGSEDLGGGLKGLWQMEGNVSTTDGGFNMNRNTYIGLNGGFGTALVGRYDHPYKTASLPFRNFNDTNVDSSAGSGTLPGNFRAASFLRSSGVLAYVSPNMSGFQASAAVVPFTEVTDEDTTKNRAPYSLALTYRQGPIYATAAYEDMEDNLGYDTWLVGATYKWGDLTIGAMYEQLDGQEVAEELGFDVNAELARILVPVTYALSPRVTLRAALQYDDFDVDVDGESVSEDFMDYALGAVYNFSPRTETYVNVVTRSNLEERKDADTVDIALGLRHKF